MNSCCLLYIFTFILFDVYRMGNLELNVNFIHVYLQYNYFYTERSVCETLFLCTVK